MKDNTTSKRSTPRPADPVIIAPGADPRAEGLKRAFKAVNTVGEAAAEQAQLKLKTFPDGFVFKFTPHPKMEGKFALYDPDGKTHAILQDPAIADLICQAVRMLFAAVGESQRLNAAPPAPLDGKPESPGLK